MEAIVIKKMNLYGLAGFFFLAGCYHFINPGFYYPLIPPYLPYPVAINVLSGVLEVALSIALLLPRFRFHSTTGLIILLILFIPSHVYFIQIGGCIDQGLCVPLWVAWVRLIVIHPLLIGWIWMNRSNSRRGLITSMDE